MSPSSGTPEMKNPPPHSTPSGLTSQASTLTSATHCLQSGSFWRNVSRLSVFPALSVSRALTSFFRLGNSPIPGPAHSLFFVFQTACPVSPRQLLPPQTPTALCTFVCYYVYRSLEREFRWMPVSDSQSQCLRFKEGGQVHSGAFSPGGQGRTVLDSRKAILFLLK